MGTMEALEKAHEDLFQAICEDLEETIEEWKNKIMRKLEALSHSLKSPAADDDTDLQEAPQNPENEIVPLPQTPSPQLPKICLQASPPQQYAPLSLPDLHGRLTLQARRRKMNLNEARAQQPLSKVVVPPPSNEAKLSQLELSAHPLHEVYPKPILPPFRQSRMIPARWGERCVPGGPMPKAFQGPPFPRPRPPPPPPGCFYPRLHNTSQNTVNQRPAGEKRVHFADFPQSHRERNPAGFSRRPPVRRESEDSDAIDDGPLPKAPQKEPENLPESSIPAPLHPPPHAYQRPQASSREPVKQAQASAGKGQSSRSPMERNAAGSSRWPRQQLGNSQRGNCLVDDEWGKESPNPVPNQERLRSTMSLRFSQAVQIKPSPSAASHSDMPDSTTARNNAPQ